VGLSVLALAIDLTARAAPSSLPLSGLVLRAHDGASIDLGSVVRQHRLTAVVFFSATCPCFAVHRARLAALLREFGARDVDFLIVDSERHSPGDVTPADLPESGLPILRDDGARLAHHLGAQYATETFVFDVTGALRYRGGFDSDRKYLETTPRTYLRDALVALLQDKAPPSASSKALGCSLRLR
jgi:hypothetical protein